MCKKESWKPGISIPNLFKRAAIIAKIRSFFADRGVIEVDTPIMSKSTTTDINISPFKTHFIGLNSSEEYDLWLTTSPEYHMKRLLAAGSGSIYQLSHGFRNGESGRHHNPEFTILEWYRIDYDLYTLMNEVNSLLETILHLDAAELISYQQVFIRYLSLDPLSADKEQLFEALKNLGAKNLIKFENDYDELLNLLFMIGIEPQIGIHKPIFIYHFPASQALLAEINREDHRIAERFEVYYKGIELANGFRELTDSHEQWHRFEKDYSCRLERGLPQYPIDTNLIDALTHGMPDCSGVALGLDRLLMLALKVNSINEVITFPIDRC